MSKRGKYDGEWVEPVFICKHCEEKLGENPFEIYGKKFCTYWCYREYKRHKRPQRKW